MTTDIFCFYLQNRLIQTSQTGGQQHSDTSPFSIPCLKILDNIAAMDLHHRDHSIHKEREVICTVRALHACTRSFGHGQTLSDRTNLGLSFQC
jgi:hypothetical protein